MTPAKWSDAFCGVTSGRRRSKAEPQGFRAGSGGGRRNSTPLLEPTDPTACRPAGKEVAVRRPVDAAAATRRWPTATRRPQRHGGEERGQGRRGPGGRPQGAWTVVYKPRTRRTVRSSTGREDVRNGRGAGAFTLGGSRRCRQRSGETHWGLKLGGQVQATHGNPGPNEKPDIHPEQVGSGRRDEADSHGRRSVPVHPAR